MTFFLQMQTFLPYTSGTLLLSTFDLGVHFLTCFCFDKEIKRPIDNRVPDCEQVFSFVSTHTAPEVGPVT